MHQNTHCDTQKLKKIQRGGNTTTLDPYPSSMESGYTLPYLSHGAYTLAPAALDLAPANLNPGSALLWQRGQIAYSIQRPLTILTGIGCLASPPQGASCCCCCITRPCYRWSTKYNRLEQILTKLDSSFR